MGIWLLVIFSKVVVLQAEIIEKQGDV